MHQCKFLRHMRTQRMTLQTTQNAKFFNRKDGSSVWPSAVKQWTPSWLAQEEYLKSEQVIQYISLVILMDVSVFHTAKRQRLAVHWLGYDLFLLFFALIYDDDVTTRGFACFSHAPASLSTVSSNTLQSSLQADTLTGFCAWTSHNSAAASIRKGEKRKKNPQRQEVLFFSYLLVIMLWFFPTLLMFTQGITHNIYKKFHV